MPITPGLKMNYFYTCLQIRVSDKQIKVIRTNNISYTRAPLLGIPISRLLYIPHGPKFLVKAPCPN